MATRRSTFAFDLSKPIKKGSLYKQGGVHKAFKVREFILYPGFLVYYDSESRWRLDLTKGETLGGRLGAVKLKGATAGIARNAPKACKYGLTITAPDRSNKRQTYLLNASSKEDRDNWIEAIRKSTPSSPHVHRKENNSSGASANPPSRTTPEPIVEKSSKDKKEELAPPSYTMRQNTACDAALAIAGLTDNIEEQKAIEEVITSVNSSLRDVNPTPITRHDTATMAALLSATGIHDGEHEQENGLDQEDDEEHETNIDSIFGKQENSSGDDESTSGSGISSTSTPTHLMSPEPADAVEMETTECVENEDGEFVTTTVTVACASNSQKSSPVLRPKEVAAGEGEGEGEGGNDERKDSIAELPRKCSSTQVLLNDNECVTLSLNLNGYDSDDTLSDEESHTNLDTLQPEDFKEPEKVQADSNNVEAKPPVKSASEAKENGVSSKTPSPSRSPLITIKEDRTGKGSTSSKGSHSSNEDGIKLSPKREMRRYSSEPFIEKKGYLYKMGGQRKSWKLRYFVLRPGVFNYFKDGSSSKAISEVKLKNLSIFFPGPGQRKQSFQFTVHTESTWNKRADWVFAGQSEREMKEWIAAFKAAGQKIMSLSPSDSDSN